MLSLVESGGRKNYGVTAAKTENGGSDSTFAIILSGAASGLSSGLCITALSRPIALCISASTARSRITSVSTISEVGVVRGQTSVICAAPEIRAMAFATWGIGL